MLKRLTIKNLFNIYSYDINFKESFDDCSVENSLKDSLSQNFFVNILTGPNGYGKTMILKMIYHLLKKNYWFFHFFEFEEIKFYFDAFVIVFKKDISTINNDSSLENDSSDLASLGESRNSVESIYLYQDEDCNTSPIGTFCVDQDLIDNTISKIKGNGISFDISNISNLETLSLYFDSGNNFPDFLNKNKILESRGASCDDNLSLALNNYSSHYLSSQRLIKLRVNPSYNGIVNYLIDTNITAQYEIDDVNAKIKDMYQKVQSDFANVSQQTDATYITRLVERADNAGDSLDDLKKKLTQLEIRINHFRELNLLKDMTLLNYPYKGDMSDDSSYRQYGKVLSLYIEDMNKKLDVFVNLYSKLSLFKDMITKKVLSNKSIKISEQGINVLNSAGTLLSNLHRLSSGEQNLIILYFNLIFSSDSHTILLIDEPENSLHVAWLQEMLSDYIKIAKTNQCQIVFATHSPTFISGRSDLTIDLYRQHHKLSDN